MKALEIDKNLGRLGIARVLSTIAPGTATRLSPLELVRHDPPELPGDGWVRLRPRLSGICGSDLATIDGSAGPYFDGIVSFPFALGHEVVADTVPADGSTARRVVVVPVLHCAVRGIDPVCDQCAGGDINRCERVAFGHLKPGLQTGFCRQTGGGWSEGLVAHELQLVDVPADLDDAAAVLIEPTACAVHAAAQAVEGPAAVIGAGTVGLLTVAALVGRVDRLPAITLVAAKHHEQRRWARVLGATVCEPGELRRQVRSLTHSMVAGEQLTSGIAQVFDCVGSSASLQQALSIVAPGGVVHVVGMPSTVTVDLTGLWHREVSIRGCYAYRRDDFDLAIDLIRRADLGRLVSARYRLEDYDSAIAHAANAGHRGATKICFDLTAST